MIKHVILNHVDTPLKILFWTVPEILMLIVPSFVGLILNQLSLGLGFSMLSFWLNKKYQATFGASQFQAVSYWFLPPNSFKAIPPSYARFYLG